MYISRRLCGPILFLTSLVFSLFVAETFARYFLPEASTNFIAELDGVSYPFHHGRFAPIEVPRDDAYRILFLGDSFTFGLGLADRSNDAFPMLTGKYLREGHGDRPYRNVQVFNQAMFSYSPTIHSAVLRHYQPTVRPQLVVLAIDDSDPQDDYVYARETIERDSSGMPTAVYPGIEGTPHCLTSIARQSKLVRLFFFSMFQIRRRINEENKSDDDRYIGDFPYRYAHFKDEEAPRWLGAFARTMSYVDMIVHFCKSRDIQVVLVSYPYEPAVTDTYASFWIDRFHFPGKGMVNPQFHILQKEYAKKEGIPYYDFTDRVRRLPDLEGFFTEDGHYTEKGSRMFAEELAAFLYPMIPAPPG